MGGDFPVDSEAGGIQLVVGDVFLRHSLEELLTGQLGLLENADLLISGGKDGSVVVADRGGLE